MAEKAVKMGIVGLGGRGLHFYDLFKDNLDAQVTALCDCNKEKLKKVKEATGGKVKCFTDISEMVSSSDLDAVIIATNDPDHKLPAIEALRAGKHCLVEKPMAQTIEDCDEMLRVSLDTGKIMMLGLELRYCVLFKKMKELIDRGDIGDVKLGWAIDNVLPGWNFFHNDFKHKKFGKSLLLQKGCHTIDLLNWFMGGSPVRVYGLGGLDFFGGRFPEDKRCCDCEEKNTCPYVIKEDSVIRYGVPFRIPDSCVFSRDVDVMDNSMLAVSYDNGKRAFYAECHFTPEYTREFTLIGDKGKLYGYYNNEFFKIRVTYRNSEHVDEYYPVFPGGVHGGGDIALAKEFVSCCLTGQQPLADGYAGRDSTSVPVAGQESIDTGNPVDIPPFKSK